MSALPEVDVCEYPDSDKLLVVTGEGDSGLREIFRSEMTVGYYEGETGGE